MQTATEVTEPQPEPTAIGMNADDSLGLTGRLLPAVEPVPNWPAW